MNKYSMIKNYFLLTLSLFIFLQLNAQLVFVADPNFEQALINNGYDTTIDGFINKSDVDQVRHLDVSHSNISNLKGIEAFSNLNQINAFYNDIGNIDILSSLPNLEYLLLWNNDISNVDFNFMPQLIKVSLGWNNLTTLDIASLSNLTYLDIASNDISVLDVSNNPNIDYLNIKSNDISILDVKSLPLLKSLFCYNNKISDLDFSSNTDLEFLMLQGNSIKTLDLSASPNLNQVNLSDNSLTYLNMKNGGLPNLQYFSATGNPNLKCIITDESFYENGDVWWFYKEDGVQLTSDGYCGLILNKQEPRLFPVPFDSYIQIVSPTEFKRYSIYSNRDHRTQVGPIKNNLILLNDLRYSGYYILKIYSENEVFTKLVMRRPLKRHVGPINLREIKKLPIRLKEYPMPLIAKQIK